MRPPSPPPPDHRRPVVVKQPIPVRSGDRTPARKQKRLFRRRVHDTARRLRELELEVYDLAVGLALGEGGPLFAWADKQAVGTTVRVDDDLLLSVKDTRIAALVELRNRIYSTVEKIYEDKG